MSDNLFFINEGILEQGNHWLFFVYKVAWMCKLSGQSVFFSSWISVLNQLMLTSLWYLHFIVISFLNLEMLLHSVSLMTAVLKWPSTEVVECLATQCLKRALQQKVGYLTLSSACCDSSNRWQAVCIFRMDFKRTIISLPLLFPGLLSSSLPCSLNPPDSTSSSSKCEWVDAYIVTLWHHWCFHNTTVWHFISQPFTFIEF